MKKAIKLCHDTIDKTLCQYYYSRASLNSLNLLLDTHSIVNRRRRQEDRWFAVADLLSYVPSYKSHVSVLMNEYFLKSPIVVITVMNSTFYIPTKYTRALKSLNYSRH